MPFVLFALLNVAPFNKLIKCWQNTRFWGFFSILLEIVLQISLKYCNIMYCPPLFLPLSYVNH